MSIIFDEYAGGGARTWIEFTVAFLWIVSFGIFPAVLGYFAGRRFSLWARAIPPLVILTAGVYWVEYSDHGFERYLLGNAAYVVACAVGAWFRARAVGAVVWRMPHFDWISIALGTAVLWKCYQYPQL